MLGRKGILGEETPFAIVNIIITGLIITAIVFIPQVLLAGTSKTYEMESPIFNERVYNQLGSADLYTGRVYPGRITSRGAFSETRILGAFETTGTPRKLAFKISLDSKEIFHHREDYLRGLTFRGSGYERELEKRALLIDSENQIATLTIDQVFMTGGRS